VNGPQREGSAWSVEKTFAGAHLLCISTRAVGTRRGAARFIAARITESPSRQRNRFLIISRHHHRAS